MGFLPAAAAQAWRLPSSEDAVLLLAIAANCILLVAPLRSALRASQDELGVEELVGLVAPTYMLFGQCFFWACYGLCTGQPDISHFNCIGALMCVAYLAFIARGARPKQQTGLLLTLAVAMVVVFSFGVMCAPVSVLDQGRVFAFTAIVFSSLQALAPAYQAIEVVRSMSPAGFPLAVATSSFVSSLLWAQYAIMVRDSLYFFSNAINALIGFLQLVAVFWVMYVSRQGPDGSGADNMPLMPRAGRKKRLADGWLAWQGAEATYGIAVQRAVDVCSNLVSGRPKQSAEKRHLDSISNISLQQAAVPAHAVPAALPSKSAFGAFQEQSDDEFSTASFDAHEPELEPEWGCEEPTTSSARRTLPEVGVGFQGSLDCIL